jgi:hypothetical protein
MVQAREKALFLVDISLPVIHNGIKVQGLLTLWTKMRAEPTAGWEPELLLRCAVEI